MLESLQERLGSILNGLTGRGALSEADVSAALREVRRALIEAARAVQELLGRPLGAHVLTAGPVNWTAG